MKTQGEKTKNHEFKTKNSRIFPINHKFQCTNFLKGGPNDKPVLYGSLPATNIHMWIVKKRTALDEAQVCPSSSASIGQLLHALTTLSLFTPVGLASFLLRSSTSSLSGSSWSALKRLCKDTSRAVGAFRWGLRSVQSKLPSR